MTATSTRRTVVGGGALMAVAISVMNGGTYGFTILAAHVLGPTHFGALAAVMGLLLVVSVMSLGLQATAARRVSAAPHLTSQIEHEVVRASYRSALVLGVLLLALSPLVSAALGLDSWSTAALLALAAVPQTVMGGVAGVLQGERRWAPLALLYAALGMGRLGAGTLAVVLRPDSVAAMAGVAVGLLAPVLVGWVALHGSRPETSSPVAAPQVTAGMFREVAHNSHALLAYFALSSADVVLARTVLEQHEAGLYAAGLILTKAVLFLPQFVVVVAFPSMSEASRARGAQLRGLALVLAIGCVTVAGVAALSTWATLFVGGGQYGAIQPLLWAFAGLGTLLAMLQVMVYGLVARQDQAAVFLVWAGLAAIVAGAFLISSVAGLLRVVTCVDTVLLLTLLFRLLRAPAIREHAPTTGPAAGPARVS